jgi:hypothetical protein
MESNSEREQLLRLQTIDSAALAGAAIAGALTVFSAPGPYVPLNGVVGLTLLILLLTYEPRRYRSDWQNLAFGGVCALCALLVVGFVTEFWESGWHWAYWVELEKEPRRSNMNYWFLSVGWLLLTGVFAGLGFKYRIPLPQLT